MELRRSLFQLNGLLKPPTGTETSTRSADNRSPLIRAGDHHEVRLICHPMTFWVVGSTMYSYCQPWGSEAVGPVICAALTTQQGLFSGAWPNCGTGGVVELDRTGFHGRRHRRAGRWPEERNVAARRNGRAVWVNCAATADSQLGCESATVDGAAGPGEAAQHEQLAGGHLLIS